MILTGRGGHDDTKVITPTISLRVKNSKLYIWLMTIIVYMMTTIQISEEIRDELKERGKMGESYEDVIKRLLEQGAKLTYLILKDGHKLAYLGESEKPVLIPPNQIFRLEYIRITSFESKDLDCTYEEWVREEKKK